MSLNEEYQVNDSNCYRIHRLEKELFGEYAPAGFDCDDAITYEWNESREKNLYGHFNFYFGITRDTISKSSMLLYMILLLWQTISCLRHLCTHLGRVRLLCFRRPGVIAAGRSEGVLKINMLKCRMRS